MAQVKILGEQIDQATLDADNFLPTQTGNAGEFLTTDGTNISWAPVSGTGTVTSVDMSVPSFLSVSGNPVTTSGTLAVSLSGTALPAVNGGTGQTGYAVGDILYASTTTALSKLAVGTDGHVLTLASGVPTWAAGGGGGVTWATYTGSSAAPTVTASSKVLALNFGNSTLSITETGTPYGALYAGAGLTVSGASDRNIMLYGGTDTNGTSTLRTLTASAVKDTVIIVPGHNSNRTAYSQTVCIGQNAQTSTTNCVAVGYSATTTGATATSVGASAQAGANSVGIGYNANASTASGVAIGSGSSASGGIAIKASASGGIAIGSDVSASTSVSVGASSSTPYTYNTAFGGSIVASSAFQTLIGHAAQGTSTVGAMIFGSQNFSQNDDSKMFMWQPRARTTDATQTEMGVNATTQSTTTINSYWAITNAVVTLAFDVDIVARETATTDASYWNVKFLYKQGATAATATIVGSPVVTLIGQDVGAVLWAVTAVADTTNGRPAIKVTGEAAKTIRWAGNCRVTQVRG